MRLVQGTCPDCNFEMIELSTKFQNADVCHLVDAVKILRRLKTEPVEILYSYLGPMSVGTYWYLQMQVWLT